ncbi:MAG: hypothetical protein R3D28_22165 [Geminicoccaceae bacterium]
MSRPSWAVGIRLVEARVIPDIESGRSSTRSTPCASRWTTLFTTGGIGPTYDDITAGCIARACSARSSSGIPRPSGGCGRSTRRRR